MKAVVDNDILFKGACYQLLGSIVAAIPSLAADAGVLGAAAFVVSKAIKRRAKPEVVGPALADLDGFMRVAIKLEPTAQEVATAADLEFQAQRLNLPLDAGESQLCAILISRSVSFIATGDKRAAVAIEALLDHCPPLSGVAGRLVCLEQLVLRIVSTLNPADLRPTICRDPSVDRTLSACFACHSPMLSIGSCEEGLRSYINSLRTSSPRILAT